LVVGLPIAVFVKSQMVKGKKCFTFNLLTTDAGFLDFFRLFRTWKL
jgi:hypothetical protein